MKYYEDWTEFAACREVGGDAWFPEIGENTPLPKQICKTRCSVRAECLDYAMRLELGKCHSIRHGLFGGMSPGERAKYEPQWLALQAPEVAA